MALLTPIDIQNKQFKRGFRGYNEDDVNDFLDQIINDYEKLTRENTHLKHELERVKKDNEQYQQLEKNLKDTLLVAQRTAEEVPDDPDPVEYGDHQVHGGGRSGRGEAQGGEVRQGQGRQGWSGR